MRAFPLNDTVVGTPSAGPRFAGPALQPHGVVVELFSDEACTVPLAAEDALGEPISSVVIDGVTLPRFTVADDDVTTVYGRALGEDGPGFPLFAFPRDGAPGADGLEGAFVHVQATPAATWTIPHSLGRAPFSVTVWIDGELVDADTHADASVAVLTFASPAAGEARIL